VGLWLVSPNFTLPAVPGRGRDLNDHVGHCVEHAIASGNKAEQRKKIAELMDVVGRADR
jgi:hypothetical protein